MEKILEDYLWNEIWSLGSEMTEYSRFPREVIKEMIERGWIKSEKQAFRTLEKWSDKGKFGWGSSLRCGWKTEPNL